MKKQSGMSNKIKNTENVLLAELSQLIEQSQRQAAIVVNSTLTMLFWQVGKRINGHILQNKRAEYGKQIVSTISTQLEKLHGRNFTEKNVRRMLQFAEQFPDFEIVVPLARQLSWSHFIALLPVKSMEAKLFYAQKAMLETLGKRELRTQIANKTFERTVIVNAQLPNLSPFPFNTFKDPYILDFLGLKDGYLEKDLEAAILMELERFILEIGKGFTFVERQKRMIIDDNECIKMVSWLPSIGQNFLPKKNWRKNYTRPLLKHVKCLSEKS
jgi:predicted nuclease of restriction endonuclease-like (RecB) superfamily